jgi:membrane dipeptidase
VYASKLLEGVRRVLKFHKDKARLATCRSEAYKNQSDGLFSIFLGLENGAAIGKEIDRLYEFYDAGVRYVTLCHSRDNQICDSCAQGGTWKGLSTFGKELVRHMNRMGMLVDVSHISDNSFYDVLATSSRPVVATHSCCRALCDHPRNMTDDMIRELAAAGGVIQINFYPLFLDGGFRSVLESSGIMEEGERIEAEFIADPASSTKRAAWNRVQDQLTALERPSFRLIEDHIDRVVELVGIDHVGIGSDYDGIEVTPFGMEDISQMPLLFEELRSRGYSESDLSKIASENFFRLLG